MVWNARVTPLKIASQLMRLFLAPQGFNRIESCRLARRIDSKEQTDDRGKILLPNLRSHEANTISIDPKNLPDKSFDTTFAVPSAVA